MASELVAAVAAIVIFGAIFVAYALGRGGNQSHSLGQGFHLIRQYKPTIVVEFGYQNETGIRAQRRVAVFRSLRHDDGRLYIFGFTGRREPRMYRVDRIISVSSLDGEVIEKRHFLTDWLGIPHRLIAG